MSGQKSINDDDNGYSDYVKDCWEYCKKIFSVLNFGEESGMDLRLSLFDKVCSPYHFFLENKNKDVDRPTEKQVEYARSLGIDVSVGMSRQELSRHIDNARKLR